MKWLEQKTGKFDSMETSTQNFVCALYSAENFVMVTRP